MFIFNFFYDILFSMKKLDIIYEDKDLLVVNKPSKILTISDGKSTNTIYSMARDYVKKQHKSNKIFIVHRLDRDTSGVLLFAKNEILKRELQTNWNMIASREYIAILEGKLKTKKGIIKEYLKEDKTHRVYATKDKSGEYAETHFEVLNYTNNNTVVKINIKTGKKNQIRVAFSNMGYPIIGDKKYGASTNPIRRLGLHANILIITLKNKNYEFSCKPLEEFQKFIKKS